MTWAHQPSRVGPERQNAHVVVRQLTRECTDRGGRSLDAFAAHRAGDVDCEQDRAARVHPLAHDDVVVLRCRLLRENVDRLVEIDVVDAASIGHALQHPGAPGRRGDPARPRNRQALGDPGRERLHRSVDAGAVGDQIRHLAGLVGENDAGGRQGRVALLAGALPDERVTPRASRGLLEDAGSLSQLLGLAPQRTAPWRGSSLVPPDRGVELECSSTRRGPRAVEHEQVLPDLAENRLGRRVRDFVELDAS